MSDVCITYGKLHLGKKLPRADKKGQELLYTIGRESQQKIKLPTRHCKEELLPSFYKKRRVGTFPPYKTE